MKPVAATLMTVLSGTWVLSTASAQSLPFEETTESHLPAMLAGSCMDAAAGDADGDGDTDLVLAMEFEPNVLLLNDGLGKFTDGSAQLPRTARDSEDVAFADFDNDGDLDLVLVSEDDKTDEFYINDGSGRFIDESTRIETDDISNALVVMDLDGDNIPDLLTGNIGTDRVLISDGRGGFNDETTQRWPQDVVSRTQDLEAADVDADGDLDILVANEGQNQLFLNENGRLRDATVGHLPARNDETREIRAVDVDGDNDLDLVVANVRFLMPETAQDYLLLNDGTGVFTTADASAFPEDARSNFTIQALDIDRDGDMDALVPSTVFAENKAEYLVTYITEAGETWVASAPDIDIDDIDGDGDIDAVVKNGNRSHSFINDGKDLRASSGTPTWDNIRALDDIDTNNDGTPELSVVALTLAPVPDAGSDNSRNKASTSQIQLVDLGADGDIDIVIPSRSILETPGDYMVLLNDGTGHFAVAEQGAVLPIEANGNGFDIEVADFDADGIADLFLCNRASIAESPASSGGLQRLLRGVKVGN